MDLLDRIVDVAPFDMNDTIAELINRQKGELEKIERKCRGAQAELRHLDAKVSDTKIISGRPSTNRIDNRDRLCKSSRGVGCADKVSTCDWHSITHYRRASQKCECRRYRAPETEEAAAEMGVGKDSERLDGEE